MWSFLHPENAVLRPLLTSDLSAILTTICLFVFGYFKSRVTGQPPIKGAFKVTAIGL
ncbi:VIT1/CCC1 transporter family protein, partial [Streptomyces sp. NPDC000888]